MNVGDNQLKKMEKYHIDDDIKVWALEAKNFPQGIPETFMKLEKIVGGFDGKDVYGLSVCNGDKVQYWAAVAGKTDGELPKGELESMAIAKGDYLSTTLQNWQENTGQMPELFDELGQSPEAKPKAWCIECYRGADALLLVETK